MNIVVRTGAEFIALGVLALPLAFGTNALRTKRSVELGRIYFRDTRPLTQEPDPQRGADQTAPPKTTNEVVDKPKPAPAKKDFGFQTVSVTQAAEFYNDPLTEVRAYIFVDARNDEAFEHGHIPGAIQADYYDIDLYLDNLMQYAEQAEKVIVYCNGGDCTDSVYMCQTLEGMGIPKDTIYLFAGGWDEWSKAGLPVETGRTE